MLSTRNRVLTAVLAGGAAATLFAVPGVAGADGTKGPTGPTQQCNQETKSGGQGVTTTNHALGTAGPTSFTLSYDTRNQADRIEVFYEGKRIKNTGLVGDNLRDPNRRGEGSTVVNVPRGSSEIVTVTVTGPEDGTIWDYTVHCPK